MTCHKKKYLTWSHAQADVRAMRRKKRCLTVYRCKHCNAFHVGEPLTEQEGRKRNNPRTRLDTGYDLGQRSRSLPTQ